MGRLKSLSAIFFFFLSSFRFSFYYHIKNLVRLITSLRPNYFVENSLIIDSLVTAFNCACFHCGIKKLTTKEKVTNRRFAHYYLHLLDVIQ